MTAYVIRRKVGKLTMHYEYYALDIDGKTFWSPYLIDAHLFPTSEYAKMVSRSPLSKGKIVELELIEKGIVK